MPHSQAFVELSKWAASRHDERRKYEWQVSLGFWGLIILAIQKKSAIPYLQLPHPFILSFVMFVFMFVWLRGVWTANNDDKKLSMYFAKCAMNEIDPHAFKKPLWPPRSTCSSFAYWAGFLTDWAMLFHIAITAILIYCFHRA